MAQENPSTASRDEHSSDTTEQDTPPAADTAHPTTTDETNDRTYIRVQPTDTSLTMASVTASFKRLHRLCRSESTDGILSRLRSNGDTRTVECLLRTDGPDAPLQYCFSVDDPELLDPLEGILHSLFPDTYELTREVHSEDSLRELFGVSTDEKTNGENTSETADHKTADTNTPSLSDDLVAVEYTGEPERADDWQTQLTPFETFQNDTPDSTHTSQNNRIPLASLVESMTDYPGAMVYQVLLQPKPDWTAEAEDRRLDIEMAADTLDGKILNGIWGTPDPDDDAFSLSNAETTRLEELGEKDTRNSFEVTARLVAGSPATHPDDTDAGTLRDFETALGHISHTCYGVAGKRAVGDDARDVLTECCERTTHSPTASGLTDRLPLIGSSARAFVADPGEVGNFCLLDGTAVTAAGERSLAPTPGERTTLPRPPTDQLERYQGPGLLLGDPLTQDGTPDLDSLHLPPALQPLHVAWFGKTGSGKSTSLINAILSNHAATEGANILIDPKGDGMATEYLRAHYATYGHADDVLYFDCANVLPAISFFDIRDELEAGVSRTTAVEDTVDHYIEMLTQIMGEDGFNQAVRSPDIIRYLVKAMFDPVHGDDAFSHRDLHEEARLMHDRQTTKAVSDSDLERMLGGVAANRSRTFDDLMQGVANRMEKIPVDKRLGKIFNHVHTDEDDPDFDLAELLDENVTIIFDTGELRSEAQRVLTLLLLSNLWTALRRRKQRMGDSSSKENAEEETPAETDNDETSVETEDDDLPLVNLYIEEAASVAVSDLLKQLLAQSRSFDCSVILAMQFPGQLRANDEDVYDEVLNNISTFVTGNVPVDKRLAERLATDEMSPQDVSNRLRALERGQWLVNLPAPFGEPEPRPFLVQSSAPPPGDPAGNRPLGAAEQNAFRGALNTVRDRTREQYGLTIGSPSMPTQAGGDESTADDGSADDPDTADASTTRVDSALPHTKRLPEPVEYDESIHALRCTSCDNRYDPSLTGMKRAIACCHALDAVERDDVPICDLNLKLTPEERADSRWSTTQLMFVQAVYNAQQLRYEPLAYDLLYDSMIRLQEYVGIESDAVQDLIDGDVLRHDTDHPHRLFTVTPHGRDVIGESYRRGVDYGHGKGDLEESSEHIAAVEIARQYLVTEYLEDPDSPVVEVTPYYDLDEVSAPASAFMTPGSEESEKVSEAYDQRRLDIAALDDAGEVVVAVEAERVNNDVKRAVPDDFDKMAECDPEEAIWVVMTQSAGHDVLAALNDPPEGEPRVEKTYASTTPPQQFSIDTPGLTAMYPAGWLRDRTD